MDSGNGKETTSLALPQMLQLGEVLYKSGYFSDIKSAAQAVVKILRGQELGLGPVTALEQVYVLQGKTALGAGLIGALIKRSGRYNYRVVKHTDDVCEIAFYENGQEIGRSSFTLKDAEKAGLLQKSVWKQYPRNLLFARALSNGARWYFPDVFNGPIYTPEELQEHGGAIETEAIVIETTNECASELSDQQISTNETVENNRQGQDVADVATQLQIKKIYALARQLNVDDEHLHAVIQKRYGKASSRELTKAQASNLIDFLTKLAEARANEHTAENTENEGAEAS